MTADYAQRAALWRMTAILGAAAALFTRFVVCSAALIYALGYSVSAFDQSGWMRGMARVNVGVASR